MPPPPHDPLRESILAAVRSAPERPMLSSAPVAAVRATPAPAGTGRRKLWQLPGHLHCQLIGTCLPIEQVRRLATGAGYENDALSDYELHHACVHAAADRHHALAIALQRAFEKRHARHVRRYARERDGDVLRTLWIADREDGDIAGALWALVTHPCRDEALITEIFGEVHMLQHGSVSQDNTLRRQVFESRAGRERAERQRDEAQDRLTAMRTERDALSRALDASRSALDSLRRQAKPPPRAALVERDPQRLQRQERLIVSLRERAAVQRGILDTAQAERKALSSDVQRLECLLERLLERKPDTHDDIPTLCGRCVLVIGGQPQQCHHFRALVEAHDGVFLHHDGGIENKATRVAELVKRADAVLCPTEQISHDAMKRAKRLCRADAKPMLFLQRSSLAAFADGLARLSDLTTVSSVPADTSD